MEGGGAWRPGGGGGRGAASPEAELHGGCMEQHGEGLEHREHFWTLRRGLEGGLACEEL